MSGNIIYFVSEWKPPMASRADIAAGRGSKPVKMTTTLDVTDRIDDISRVESKRCGPCLLVTFCCAFFAAATVGLTIAFPTYVYTRPTTTDGAFVCRRVSAADAAGIYDKHNVADTTTGVSASSDQLMDTLCDAVENSSLLRGAKKVVVHAADLNLVILYLHALNYFTLERGQHGPMTAYKQAPDNLSIGMLLQVSVSEDVYIVMNMAKMCSRWALTSDASLNVDATSLPYIFDDSLVCLHVLSKAAAESFEAEVAALQIATYGDHGRRRLIININAASSAANAANQTSSDLVDAVDNFQRQRQRDLAIERLSTGKRINYASNDAAGQAVKERLDAEIEGVHEASRQTADAQSMINTNVKALQEFQTQFLNIREKSANSSLNEDDLAFFNKRNQEFQQRHKDIDASDAETEAYSANFWASIRGMKPVAPQIPKNTTATAEPLIDRINKVIARVSEKRISLNGVSYRLSSSQNNLDEVFDKLSASKGRIQDTEFAAETGKSALTKEQILSQAAMSMLDKANLAKGGMLSLLQGSVEPIY